MSSPENNPTQPQEIKPKTSKITEAASGLAAIHARRRLKLGQTMSIPSLDIITAGTKLNDKQD